MRLRAGRQTVEFKQTISDRVVSWFDPKAGVERVRARGMLALAGGYEGGSRGKRSTKRWRPFAGSANADILPDLPDLQSRSRDLARNMPIATGAISTVVTNVVGDGLTLQSLIDRDLLALDDAAADAWQTQAEREWRLFCKTADFSGVQSFEGMQSLVYRAAKESGDVLVIRRFREDAGGIYGTKLQVIEADRLSNPNRQADTPTIIAGVEVDVDAVPIAYHVADKHPGNLRNTGAIAWNRVPAKAANGTPIVLHLFDRLRPEQTRGVPYLAPVIDALKQLSNYSDAELSAAVVSAFYTVFLTSGTDEDANPIVGEKDESLDDNELKLGAGAVISLAPGEKPEFANPSRPNSAFDPFVTAILRQVGVALELPFELLIKHFTASYSASRAALEMAWQFFRCQRCWHAARFCQVVYEWVIEEAVARGRLVAPGFDNPIVRQAYLGAEWIGPTRMSLDPMKDAQADQIDVQMGTKTLDEVCIARTGGTFERKNAQRAKEVAARKGAGIAEPQPSGQQPGAGNQPPEDGTPPAQEGYAA